MKFVVFILVEHYITCSIDFSYYELHCSMFDFACVTTRMNCCMIETVLVDDMFVHIM